MMILTVGFEGIEMIFGAIVDAKRICIGVVMVSVVALASCTTVQSKSYSSAENELRNIETKRVVQGVATGAIAGAALGALIGAASGGGGRSIAQGALIGGGVGAVGGGIYADSVNENTREYAESQAGYKDMISSADANIASYRRVSAVADTITAETNTKISRLNKELASNKITAAQYRAELASSRGNIQVLQQKIDSAKSDASNLDSAIKNGGPSSLQGRKSELLAAANNLQAKKARLVDAYNRAPANVRPGV